MVNQWACRLHQPPHWPNSSCRRSRLWWLPWWPSSCLLCRALAFLACSPVAAAPTGATAMCLTNCMRPVFFLLTYFFQLSMPRHLAAQTHAHSARGGFFSPMGFCFVSEPYLCASFAFFCHTLYVALCVAVRSHGLLTGGKKTNQCPLIKFPHRNDWSLDVVSRLGKCPSCATRLL